MDSFKFGFSSYVTGHSLSLMLSAVMIFASLLSRPIWSSVHNNKPPTDSLFSNAVLVTIVHVVGFNVFKSKQNGKVAQKKKKAERVGRTLAVKRESSTYERQMAKVLNHFQQISIQKFALIANKEGKSCAMTLRQTKIGKFSLLQML